MAAKVEKKVAKPDSIDRWAAKPNAAFDINKISDMSDYNPETSVVPTGDTIKLAVVVFIFWPGGRPGAGLFRPDPVGGP